MIGFHDGLVSLVFQLHVAVDDEALLGLIYVPRKQVSCSAPFPPDGGQRATKAHQRSAAPLPL
jgi:hypothetical protein